MRHLRGRYEVCPRLWTPVTDRNFRLVFMTCAVPQDTVQSTTRLPGMLSTPISRRGMAPSLRILRAWKATLGELHRGGAHVRLCVALTSSNILKLSAAHDFPFRITVIHAVTTKTQLSRPTGFSWCPVTGKDGKPSGKNGQACFWFSNGCSIGCKSCDGSSRGPIPNSHDPTWHCDPTKPGKCRFNTCNNPVIKATVCDPKHRTVNTAAACGSAEDWYYYSPWRMPGAAPVFDSCGMAGGHKPSNGGFGGIYVNTSHAKLGDKGTDVLPKKPTGVIWKAGQVYEVAWTIEANHGGG